MTSTPPANPPTKGRPHFQDELRGLELSALGAIDIALEQIDRTLEALAHQDVELAAIVIADDDRVDGRYLETHQGILSLLARQSPVAGDLRLVAALLHVIMRVERIGDNAVDIGEQTAFVVTGLFREFSDSSHAIAPPDGKM